MMLRRAAFLMILSLLVSLAPIVPATATPESCASTKGECVFECDIGDKLLVHAHSSLPSLPVVAEVLCGGGGARCDGIGDCEGGTAEVDSRGEGICRAVTPLTSVSCGVVRPAASCTVDSVPGGCYFRCRPGDFVRIQSTAAYGVNSAVAECGETSVSCSSTCTGYSQQPAFGGAGRCKADGSVTTVTCSSVTIEKTCSVLVENTECLFHCSPGDRVHLVVSSWSGSGYPSGSADCGGFAIACQRLGSCGGTAGPVAIDGLGRCRSYTAQTTVTCGGGA